MRKLTLILTAFLIVAVLVALQGQSEANGMCVVRPYSGHGNCPSTGNVCWAGNQNEHDACCDDFEEDPGCWGIRDNTYYDNECCMDMR